MIDLRARIAAADAILFSTPEYAGAMPGSFKNLLDWTVGGVEISEKPVGWINISPTPDGAARTYESLTTVLQYTGANGDRGCVCAFPVPRTRHQRERPDRRPSVCVQRSPPQSRRCRLL